MSSMFIGLDLIEILNEFIEAMLRVWLAQRKCRRNQTLLDAGS